MIRIDSGHLGSGNWKVKQQDGVTFLSHRLPFSPRNEFRIGTNEVVDVQLQSIDNNKHLVKIIFTDDRSCSGVTDKTDFDQLLKMVDSNQPAPVEDRNTNTWVKGLVFFFAAAIIFEIIK